MRPEPITSAIAVCALEQVIPGSNWSEVQAVQDVDFSLGQKPVWVLRCENPTSSITELRVSVCIPHGTYSLRYKILVHRHEINAAENIFSVAIVTENWRAKNGWDALIERIGLAYPLNFPAGCMHESWHPGE